MNYPSSPLAVSRPSYEEPEEDSPSHSRKVGCTSPNPAGGLA